MARKSSTSKPTVSTDDRMLVLYGREPMLRELWLKRLIDAGEKQTGQPPEVIRYDADQATLADVLDDLRSIGLMGQYRVVVVDQAEKFVTAHRASLERYAADPQDNATLVLRSETWRRGNLDKLIDKCGQIIECDNLKPAAAVTWLTRRANDAYQARIDKSAAQALVDHVGVDMARLDSELAKLATTVGRDKPITQEVIEQMSGEGGEQRAWEIQDALLSGNPSTAMEKVRQLIDVAGEPDVLIMYFATTLMRNLCGAVAQLDAGVNPSQVARSAKMWGPRQQQFLQAARRLGPTGTARLLEQAVQLDRRAKSGRGDHRTALEKLSILMADHLR
jgi:DNA polymerase-3 subunit delta